MITRMLPMAWCLLLWLVVLPHSALAVVKVFIMAGQSNMAGHGHAQHLQQLVTTGSPEWAPYWDSQKGNFSVRNDVFVNQNGLRTGNLTVGFGDIPPTGEVYFGPEVGFGWAMGEYYKEPVLIIKSAWGAVSLAVDFRPPSSGGEGWQWIAMMNLIHNVLGSLGKYVPAYNRQGYEIVGFVWFQGEADAYTPSRAKEYKSNLVNFINDVRYHLAAPRLPFLICEMGGEGAYADEPERKMRQIEQAVVKAVPYTRFSPTAFLVNYNVTEIFEPDYHYYGRADVYVRMGRSFARNMLVLLGVLNGPTAAPSAFTQKPTIAPTKTPTVTPSKTPTVTPSKTPTAAPVPTLAPSSPSLPATTCIDSNQTFYNVVTKRNNVCGWLAARRRRIKNLCAVGMPARTVCPKTCGTCSTR